MIIDAHAHLMEDTNTNEHFLRECKRLGIDMICGFGPPDSNEVTRAFMEKHPKSVIGFCSVIPDDEGRAVDEFASCVQDHGMRGLKLLLHRKATDPAVFRLAEKSVQLGVPILIHTFMRRGIMPERDARFPNESDATDIAELARNYPDAMIIMAHFSVGDWEYGIKAVKGFDNVYLDMSGTGVDLGSVEMAVKQVGGRRVVFGTDNLILAALGKLSGAMIDEETRELISSANILRLLSRKGRL